MTLPLDHLVILVRDLDRAVADYGALGFTVLRGGTHADGATHNALIVFADGSYLELIAFLKPAPQHRWSRFERDGVEGFVDFALLPDSVDRVVQTARARGLAYDGPLDGGRLRPDGARLAWQIGTPPAPELPFLCGDLTPRALRVPEGDVRIHPNGVQGVASVTIAVTDIVRSQSHYRALLGPDAQRTDQAVALPGAGVVVAVFDAGPAELVLVSPGPKGESPAALDAALAARGAAVYAVALRGTGPAPAISLALTRTHGARFEIHPA